jgi:hypothetical protein
MRLLLSRHFHLATVKIDKGRQYHSACFRSRWLCWYWIPEQSLFAREKSSLSPAREPAS